MATTFKFGNGNWAVKDGAALAYNDENGNFKPLPFDFTRASTATRVNKDGLVETVPSGKPRIDFTDNTSGHLLLEPSRTNLYPYSNQSSSPALNTFSAGTSTISITNDYGISPDGTQNAMRFEATCGSTLSDRAGLRDFLSMTATDATLSFYGKSNTGSNQTIAFHFIGGTKTVVTLTNEWQRFEYTETSNTGNYAGVEIRGTYTDRDVDVLLFGFQMEQASYATSYIPTEGSAVTRSAETANGAGNSTIFNDSEGVLYAEMAALANDGTLRRIAIPNSGVTGLHRIELSSTDNKVFGVTYVSPSNQAAISHTLTDVTTAFKIAYKFKANDFALWVNGVEVGTDTSGSLPTGLVKINFDNGAGGNDFYGKIKDLRVYDTALSDSELQALTS